MPQKKTKRKRCACFSAGGASKEIVEKASGSRTPLFFRGGGCRMIEYVSDEMPVISSHIVGKDQRNFGTTNKNKYRVHAVNPLEKKVGFSKIDLKQN